jgi:hypothetical protein
MLDVHPPHQSVHTWRDFFIHIATIVVGLLIAVGLEQTVELFHHRHQRHQLEAALHAESDRNLSLLHQDIAIMQRVIDVTEHNKSSLDHARSTHTTPTFIDFDPASQWLFPTNSVWAAARDNGTLSLIPSDQARHLSRLDFSTSTIIETGHQVFDAEYRVLAFVHLHPTVAQLTTSEQDALLLALSTYEETAAHSLRVMQRSETTLNRTED